MRTQSRESVPKPASLPGRGRRKALTAGFPAPPPPVTPATVPAAPSLRDRAPLPCGRKYLKPFKQSPHNRTTNHRSHSSPVASPCPPLAPRAALTPPCRPRGAGDPGSAPGACPPPQVCRPARHSLPEPVALTLKDILHMSAATPARPARFRPGTPAPASLPLPAAFRSGAASRAARSRRRRLRRGHAGRAGRRRGRGGLWGGGGLRGAQAPTHARPPRTQPAQALLLRWCRVRSAPASRHTALLPHAHPRSHTHRCTRRTAHILTFDTQAVHTPVHAPSLCLHTLHAHPHSCDTYTHSRLRTHRLTHQTPTLTSAYTHYTPTPIPHLTHLSKARGLHPRTPNLHYSAGIDDADETGEKNPAIASK